MYRRRLNKWPIKVVDLVAVALAVVVIVAVLVVAVALVGLVPMRQRFKCL